MPTPYQARRYIGDVNIGAAGDPIGYARLASSIPARAKYQLCDGKPSIVAVNSSNAAALTTGALGGFNADFAVSITNNTPWATGVTTSIMYGFAQCNGRHFAIGNNGGNYKLYTRVAGTGAWTVCTGLPASVATGWIYEHVIYAFGKYWSLGTGANKLYSSTDGIAWTIVSALTTTPQTTMTFCDGALWWIGSSACRYTTDGTTWNTPTNSPYQNGIGSYVTKMVKVGSRYFICGGSATVMYTTNPYTGTWTTANVFSFTVDDCMIVTPFSGNELLIWNGVSNNYSFMNAATLAITTRTYSQMFGVSWIYAKAIATGTGVLFFSSISDNTYARIAHITNPTGSPVTPTNLASPGSTSSMANMTYDPTTQMVYWPGRDYGSDYLYNYVGNCVPNVPVINGLSCYIKLG